MIDLGEVEARHSFIEKQFGYPASLHATIKRVIKDDVSNLISEIRELRQELLKERQLRIAWESLPREEEVRI